MDYRELERIIFEEVQKALAEHQREEQTLLPPSQAETLDSHACKGPSCSVPSVLYTAPVTKVPVQPVVKKEGPAVLLLFSCANEKWDVIRAAFSAWDKEGIQLDAVVSQSTFDIHDMDELASLGIHFIDQPAKIRSLMMDMSEYSAVFCPSMSRNFSSKLALGITDNAVLNLALSALAQKMPVFGSTDGMEPTGCVACGNNVPGIQEILRNYQKQLEKMGMKLLPAKEAVEDLYHLITAKADSRDGNLISHLITEAEAVKLHGPVLKSYTGRINHPSGFRNLSQTGD